MEEVLIVGAGLYGSVCAYELRKLGYAVTVIEKRNTIGGNIATSKFADYDVHEYGAHIFHTSDRKIWDYINQFDKFETFINSPKARYKDKLYSLPFNMNTFYELWGTVTPEEAKRKIKDQIINIENPKNLEEQALATVGLDIYEKLIRGYTEKQWNAPAKDLPASLIKRLPLRFSYNNNYFNDTYQGIPQNGYSEIIRKMLAHIPIYTGTNFFDFFYNVKKNFYKVIYTGMIDEFYNFKFGRLDYRSLKFEQEIVNKNYQGNAVINYTDKDVPYTRIIEHKFFKQKINLESISLITKEYPQDFKEGAEPYYPINDDKNNALYKKYFKLAKADKNIIFGGRLGLYKYINMDETIKLAKNMIEREFH